MELHKAIKEIVASKGADMICNIQIINYLLDYQAFKEKPATKLILRAIIDSGYAESILALSAKTDGWQTKFKQYQHEFIDSCGYKEELAAYVFESLAYGIGLNVIEGSEPEIRSQFNVDSFFDIPEVEQPQQPIRTPNQKKQKTDPTDLYTIALSFYNEGKYQQAKGFIEKTISLTPSSSIPSNHLRLLGDIYRMIGQYEDAVKAYNECFTHKANELKCSIDELRGNLKQHKVKGFENIMFSYFFCLYYAKKMNDAQWLQFVKGEARYGLMEAIKFCADNGINPVEDHFDIYFTDRDLIEFGDFLYEDGTFSHELSKTKQVIARIAIVPTSDFEHSQGWTHGYIIPLFPICYDFRLDASKDFYEYEWAKECDELPFPHSHYTLEDINHWNKIDTIESEHFISIKDYSLFPAFRLVNTLNSKNPIPITDSSNWFLPSIHHFKRIINISLFPNSNNLDLMGIDNGFGYNDIINKSRKRNLLDKGKYWTSSQADGDNAISYGMYYGRFTCDNKKSDHMVLPFAAF